MSFIELNNELNTKVILSTLGASIYDIQTLDKNNKLESIVYTTKTEDDFYKERSNLGKTIGRTGGRISNSKFILNNKEYHIPSWDPNGLHGGNDGLSYKEFEYSKVENNDYYEVDFYYFSPNLESGYPGDSTIHVVYRLYKKINKLSINYIASSNEDTLMNLSNHTYFNLSGNSKSDILKHELCIHASKMERIEKLLPREIIPCEGIYSFNNSHFIGDYLMDKEIINNTNGYDFPYILDKNDDYDIILKDIESKRVLKIKTTYPVVVVYTCNYVENLIMNNDKKMTPYYAVCLECMYHPNTINSDFLENKLDILKKDNRYFEQIDYYFEVENE